jgi:biotin carboxylase
VDADEGCPGRARADEFYPVSTIDEDAVLAVCRRERVEVVGVISSDRPLRVAARLNAVLGHPYPITREQAIEVTEKPRMKKTLEAAGVPHARYVRVEQGAPLDAGGLDLNYPLVVKPADSSASRGISLVERAEALEAATRRAIAASRSGACVVEEFLSGQEISVDAVVVDGVPHVLLITDGFVDRTPGRFGLYLMNAMPSSISPAAREQVRNIIGAVASHLGVRHSLFFFQMMANGERVSVIEYSARNAGAAKSRFIRTAIAVDVVDLYLRLLLGEPVELPPKEAEPHATLNFLYGRAGTVGTWRGFEELQQAGVLAWYEKFKPTGAVCEGMRSGADRLGVYALIARDERELAEQYRCVEERIAILDSGGNDMLVRGLREAALSARSDAMRSAP